MRECENCNSTIDEEVDDFDSDYCEMCRQELLDEDSSDKRDRDKWQG
jgi:hypothetical protein